MGEGILRQEDALVRVSPMSETEMAIRLRDTEDDAVVRLVTSAFIQGHKVMRGPSAYVPSPVFKDHIQVFAALGTTSVLPDIGRILAVVVELHFLVTGTECSPLGCIQRLLQSTRQGRTATGRAFRPSHLSYNTSSPV